MKKRVWGLTGSIGAGKTEAGKYFQSLGADFINADEVVRRIYEPDQPGYLKLVNYFGDKFFDKKGQVDTKKLGAFIFSDENKRKIVNFLIHPVVFSETQKMVDQSKASVIFVEAIDFDPEYLGKLISGMIWIQSSLELQRERVEKRGGFAQKNFDLIYRAQMKPVVIDEVVENLGTLEVFQQKLQELWVKKLQNG